MTFKQIFFRIYDRKIAAGEITFSQTGIGKEEFTKLCTEDNYVFARSTVERIGQTMRLTEDEMRQLSEAAGWED